MSNPPRLELFVPEPAYRLRRMNSILLGMMNIVPATAVYDAVFYEEIDQQDGKKYLMVRALIWVPGSKVLTFALPEFYVDPGGVSLRKLLTVVDIYSSVFKIVKGRVREQREAPPNVPPEQFKEAQRREVKNKMDKLMRGEIPQGFEVEATYTVTPILDYDEYRRSFLAVRNAVFPVKVTRTRVFLAKATYEFDIPHCPFYSETDIQNAPTRYFLFA